MTVTMLAALLGFAVTSPLGHPLGLDRPAGQDRSIGQDQISLEGTWKLTQAEHNLNIPAQVPGEVHLDLLKAGKIPDPFVGTNDRAVQWVGEATWTYDRTFTVTPGFLAHHFQVIRCEGLDTLAKIEVNGKELAHTDNMFRTWEFDLKGYLKSGTNQIKITFDPIEPYLKDRENQPEFPGKPIDPHGWGYIRKSPYQQGWDFAPKLITVGIWRPISLIGWDEARLTSLQITQHHRPTGPVDLNLDTRVDTSEPGTIQAKISFHGHPVKTAVAAIRDGIAKTHLTIDHPLLWWPNEMGPQNLYEVEVEVRNAKGQILDRTHKRIGLRTITWYPKTNNSPLTLAVNGRKFFAKGSNWVPGDAIPSRSTPERERKLVNLAVADHMNLLRLWGGGFYENDAFFDACDEKGLLVWFEFKFADAAYPSFDPKWLNNVTAEAYDNVSRVRHHPCVAIYSGNNEVIGFIADKTDRGHMSRDDYNLLFHKALASVIHDLAPDATYTPGSPEIGDDHYWDVWHGSAGFESYRNRHGFMSEYGFQAFPVPQSVDQFTTPADRTSTHTEVMNDHQRNWRDGNSLIVSTMRRYYRQPKDFDSTLWLSQIQQADGIATGVESWRRDWPHSSGSLVWQFNDCWPSISWSMVDVYGRPKALYYRLHHAYAPVALSALAEPEGNISLWVVNDRPKAMRGQMVWSLVRTDGRLLEQTTLRRGFSAGASRAIFNLAPIIQDEKPENLVLFAKLSCPGEPESTTSLIFTKPKALNLQDPKIQATVKPKDSTFEVTLRSSAPALSAWVELKGINADYSDNFVALQPGEPVTITIRPVEKKSLAEIQQALRVRSLFDTYLPGIESDPVTIPDGQNRIIAAAENAVILGDTAILESGAVANIGNWTNPHDGLRWNLGKIKSGTYEVTAEVSIPNNEAGSTFKVEIDGNTLTGTVPPTGSWTTYRTITLGQVHLSHEGTLPMTLTPLTKPSDHVMNLRSITLNPVP